MVIIGRAAVGVVFSSAALVTMLPMALALTAATALVLALFFNTPPVAPTPTPTAPDNDRAMVPGLAAAAAGAAARGCLGGLTPELLWAKHQGHFRKRRHITTQSIGG